MIFTSLDGLCCGALSWDDPTEDVSSGEDAWEVVRCDGDRQYFIEDKENRCRVRSSTGEGITTFVPSLFRLEEGRVHGASCTSLGGTNASEPHREVSREELGSEGRGGGLIFNEDFIFFSIGPWSPCAMFGVESFRRAVE